MALESKKAVVKEQCIALKSDRNQCVRNAGDGSQFCWQHQKSENKMGTILNPAPMKPKSNRGRPKGSVSSRKIALAVTGPIINNVAESSNPIINNVAETSNPIINNVAESSNPIINNVAESSIPIINNLIINDSSELLNPIAEVTKITSNNYLLVDLFKDINIDLGKSTDFPDTQVAVGPFNIEVPLGAEEHINIIKEINFSEGNYTISDVCKKIKEFFNTSVTEDDLYSLINLCNETDNDDLCQHYSEILENLTDVPCLHIDLQINMLKIKSIVCRDSKYICVMEENLD